MDTSQQPLATESFSYSWLATESSSFSNINHSVLLPEDHDEPNHNFDFDISMSKTNPSSLVHADKLFSNGLILPQSIDINPSSSSSSSSSPSPLLVVNPIIIRHHHPSPSSFRKMFLGKWSKFVPGKIISKYVKCLIPMRESIGRGGRRRVDDVNRIAWEVKSWSTNNTPQVVSPIRETSPYCSAWSDIDETSIRDAILYCKTSGNGLC